MYAGYVCNFTLKSVMAQAQRLLAEANKQAELHAAMQCKQQGEQKEIIRKHEVIHPSSYSTMYSLELP